MSISGLKRSGIYRSYRQFSSCTNAERERRTYWSILCPLFFKLVLESLNRNISSVSTDQLFNKRWEIQRATGKQLRNLLMLAWQNCINSSFGWQHVRDNSQRNFPPVHVWVHRRKLVSLFLPSIQRSAFNKVCLERGTLQAEEQTCSGCCKVHDLYFGYHLPWEPMLALWKGGWTEDRSNGKASCRHRHPSSSHVHNREHQRLLHSKPPTGAVLPRSILIQPQEKPAASFRGISAYDKPRLKLGNPSP